MDYLLIICLLISFVATLFLTAWWIRRAEKAGLTGIDMNKYTRRRVAEMGGLPVVTGFLISMLLYIGYRIFVYHDNSFVIQLLGVVSTILLITVIGIVDDILGWKIGLRQWQKPVLILFAALPMMMINAGHSTVYLPVIGKINLGIFYALILVPVAIMCVSNGFNMLAGFNGLEAGMGIIMLSTLGLIAWIHQGLGEVAMIAFAMVAGLIAFLFYNKYPARVFPGDTLTYTVGALIAMVAILGNAEKAAFVLFLPYFLEFFLKSRGGWRKESFGKPMPDNTLELPEKRVYSMTHLMIKIIKMFKKPTERDVVYSIWAVEVLIAIIVIGFLFL